MRGTFEIEGGCEDIAPGKHDDLFRVVFLDGNAKRLLAPVSKCSNGEDSRFERCDTLFNPINLLHNYHNQIFIITARPR
jgi:hypothetical protein